MSALNREVLQRRKLTTHDHKSITERLCLAQIMSYITARGRCPLQECVQSSQVEV